MKANQKTGFWGLPHKELRKYQAWQQLGKLKIYNINEKPFHFATNRLFAFCATYFIISRQFKKSLYSKGDPVKITNYSALSTTSKLFEKAILTRMIKFMDTNKLLGDQKSGYRNDRLTATTIS